jgi:hypothetical protein
MHDRRWLFGALVLAACGSGEAPPPPPAAPPTVAPVVEPPPSSVVAPATDVPAAPPTDVRPEGPTLAPGGVLAVTSGSFEMLHTPIGVDVVAYPANVQTAIEHALRAKMRDALDGFELDSGDPEYPNSFGAACAVQIALADLVSYACHVDFSIGRGGGDVGGFALTLDVTDTGVREVETDDLLVEGTDYEAVAEAADGDPDGPMVVTPEGIGFVDMINGDVDVVPYAELGTLVHRESILARVRGALDHAGETTPLSTEAAPPETIRVVAEPRPFAAAVMLAARAGETWVFAAQAGTPIDVTTPATVPATDETTGAADGGEEREVPWSTPARVHRATLRRATALHARPHGPPSGPTFLAGTVVATVLGDLGPGPSRTGAGQWALVVVNEGTAGWIPAALIGDVVPWSDVAASLFVDALPPATRDAVRPRVLALELSPTELVAYAETTPGNTTLAYFAAAAGALPGAPRLVLTHAGSLSDVRVLATDAARTGRLLMVTWLVPGGLAQSAEIYAFPASGTTPAAPLLTLALPLPSVPARERVTITTGITRHGVFHPLITRGPNRTEVAYTWNGTTLVAPAPPP